MNYRNAPNVKLITAFWWSMNLFGLIILTLIAAFWSVTSNKSERWMAVCIWWGPDNILRIAECPDRNALALYVHYIIRTYEYVNPLPKVIQNLGKKRWSSISMHNMLLRGIFDIHTRIVCFRVGYWMVRDIYQFLTIMVKTVLPSENKLGLFMDRLIYA